MNTIEGLNRPVPDQKINSPSSQEKPLLTNGSKELSLSQEGKVKGRSRWNLILPLALSLGTATALMADYLAEPLSLTQSPDNGHRILYHPPQRNLDIPSYLTDQFKDRLGVRVARGDSGEPTRYRLFLPVTSKEISADIITPLRPEDCRTLTANAFSGVIITEEVTIRLLGAVVGFPDQEQALNTARNSTYYHDLLYQRLVEAREFINRFLPFQFEIEIFPEPLVTPQPFTEIEGRLSFAIHSGEYLESYRSNQGLPIRRYPEYFQIQRRGGYQGVEYPVYVLMYAPDPTVTLRELYRRGDASASAAGGRIFTRSRGQGGALASAAVFSWYSADPASPEGKSVTVEHEIIHAINVLGRDRNLGLVDHDYVNPNSVMFGKGVPTRDRAILTKANASANCSP